MSEHYHNTAADAEEIEFADFGNAGAEDLRNLTSEDFGAGFGNGSSVNYSSGCEPYLAGKPLVMGEPYPRFEELARVKTLDLYETVQIALIVALVVVSVAGNLAVVAVVYFNRFLRSSVNCYLANLAVADLLITLACWPTLVNRLTQPLYILGRPICKITVLALGTCVNVSALTLAVVAGGRLYAVLFPLRALRSASRPILVISLLWAASFTLALPAFYVRDTRLFQLLVTMFFLPEVVMVVAYTVIIVRLYCVKRGPQDEPSTTRGPQHPASSDHAHLSARRKVVKMTAAVVVVFTLCWSPLHALSLFSLLAEASHRPLPEWFSTAEFWAYFLGYCNSALNPLLYCGCSEKFRVGLKSLVLQRPRWPRQRQGVGSGHSWSPSTLLMRLTSSSLSSKSSVPGVISRQSSRSLSGKATDSAWSPKRASGKRGVFKAYSRNSESVRSNPPPELDVGDVGVNGEVKDANQNGKRDLHYLTSEAKDGRKEDMGHSDQNGKEDKMKWGTEYEEKEETRGEGGGGGGGGELTGLEEEEEENGSSIPSQNGRKEESEEKKQKEEEFVFVEEGEVDRRLPYPKKLNGMVDLKETKKGDEDKGEGRQDELEKKEDAGSRLLTITEERMNNNNEHEEKREKISIEKDDDAESEKPAASQPQNNVEDIEDIEKASLLAP
ncbi:gastrin/cholecystokinin type B receptor-like isoform X2 [Eriocheir sinensis]|uniref:gastrin/cholecystokinin type B receptor-like isoform X2 n=1 Tax=Eriocheir sinensis TaxID=95602 RepID=UPI0021C7A2AC|nr:gastrin/cholecystokinin type B receptor-like isoform X2 [Eriocheir sinensis]